MTENELTTYNRMSEVEKKQYRKHLYDNDRKKFYKLWRYNNQEKSNARHKRYEKKNYEKRVQYYKDNEKEVLDRRLKRVFGITVEVYEDMVEKQSNLCAICGKHETRTINHKIKKQIVVKSLSVDHNHVTGDVRGLLCYRCNLMLGHAHENQDILINTINYIIKHDSIDDKLQEVMYLGFYGEDSKVNFRINYESSMKRRKQTETLFNEQLSGCAICNLTIDRGVNLHSIDHNHLTGNVRSLLCNNCNWLIGHSCEDIRILLKGIKYLRKHEKKLIL